jgi:peptidoglycan/xylan/chitin deacetylase (PgdA/CDA1 family)
MSRSGPRDYLESESSIRAYTSLARDRDFPTTIFAHPEVARNHRELLLELEGQGACLGLHLHPYKLGDGRYREDLGAYSASEQCGILQEAGEAWEEALGQRPLYFRPGYFSASDNTFRVLCELGFRGGSVSIPGRVLPAHASVWAGAKVYPHRAHLNFRHLAGCSGFLEVPVSVDFQRPMERGEAGERGYEWLYVPSIAYNHREVVRNILERFRRDLPKHPVLVLDTHNDQDYSDPEHPARKNLDAIFDSIERFCADMGLEPTGCTLATLCEMVLADG